jgi:hypothetical protein
MGICFWINIKNQFYGMLPKGNTKLEVKIFWKEKWIWTCVLSIMFQMCINICIIQILYKYKYTYITDIIYTNTFTYVHIIYYEILRILIY